jgi:UDP-GlcNAc:undecaprenyl-phosphate/decaprenyl-phosphate GlcNAc-1-phosphate transferase
MNWNWVELLFSAVAGLATSLSLIPAILKLSRRYGFAQRAREAHHTHHVPVPRLGGIAMAAAMVVVAAIFYFIEPGFLKEHDRWLLLCGALAMFGLGLCDDLSALGARRKLLGQIVIASLVFFGGIGINQFRIPFTNQLIDFGLWAWPVTVFWLVAMTNLINLIDGVDGLAGGICLMLMALLVYVSWHTGFTAIISAGMVGALLGFLRYNFPPARIYMGDGGAYFLGFLIGCQTIVSSQKGTIFAALAAPLFVLALPILDTSLAILRRGLRGLPLFRPDRKHLHHRLLASGYSRRNVVLGLYGFTAFFLLLGFLAFYWQGQYFALFLGIGTVAIILAAGRFNFSREWFSIGRVLGNSLDSRADIQYAICLSRCLELEGNRAETLTDIADDVVFIARKLGFSSVRIRLEDDEKSWQLTGMIAANGKNFRHSLNGHKYCFLELTVSSSENAGNSPEANSLSEARLNTVSIQADLLAEGWNKAIKGWKQRHQLPPRFDARLAEPSRFAAPSATRITPDQSQTPETRPVPLDD